jgi:Uncharacterized protein conserved in bacteria (DUF2272)
MPPDVFSRDVRVIVMMVVMLGAVAGGPRLDAQQGSKERLPQQVLDVLAPSARVRGLPGEMAIQSRPCRVLPVAETRRRIVDAAVQEWGFFGFRTVDQSDISKAARLARQRSGVPGSPMERPDGRPRWRLAPEEAAHVAATVAGYWSITPEGSWIVGRQNADWKGPEGTGARWHAPWSAAFISWVMCEAGLGSAAQFQRAIAHHTYIDQAIRARDGRAGQAAFVAYDTGETVVTPGDLLCSSRRPVYRSVADRRRQLGVGARTHCDIVVKVDEARERILAIGGNVRATVSLKLLRAQRAAGTPLRVVDPDEDSRPIFIHLKLRADPIGADPLATSATMQALGCGGATRSAVLPTVADSFPTVSC